MAINDYNKIVITHNVKNIGGNKLNYILSFAHIQE